jgi:RHH-type proline utilization regulon transcriptional repressor/proline dehydrogenase/delta 1-pyrroline-5-carboxylate dehydrogenase
MIRPPSGDLENALKELEKGETWALMLQKIGDNPNLCSPAIKWDVSPGSYTHMTEFFGPVLAVLKARNLDHAIELVNQTGYGLTSGLESLDHREQEIWQEEMATGNLYINRVTTGAIVGRQPFGGIGKSAFGPGIKAGGPNYVAGLMRFSDRDLAAAETTEIARPDLEALRLAVLADTGIEARDRIAAAIVSYENRFREEFASGHDNVLLLGQDNIRRYRPVPAVRVRIHPADTSFEIFARVIAAKTVGCRITVSSPPELVNSVVEQLDRLTESWAADVEFVEESDAVLAEVIAEGQTDRLRYGAPDRVPEVVRRAIGGSGVYIADAPVLVEGRIELLWYLTEQSISHDYHRYGNLGARSDEKRRPVL